jgi:hypothetical protein
MVGFHRAHAVAVADYLRRPADAAAELLTKWNDSPRLSLIEVKDTKDLPAFDDT